MSFRDKLNQLKNRFEDYNRQHNLLPFGQGDSQYPPQHQQYFGTGGGQQPQYPYPQPQQYNQQTQFQGHPPQGQSQYQVYPSSQPPWQQNAPYQQQPQAQWQIQQNNHPSQPPWQQNPSDNHFASQQQPVTQQQGGYNRPPAPPPIPSSSHPNAQPPSYTQTKIYWQARFDPATPVSQEWEQKLGNNNGWGNAELEHYTSRAENSFYTSDRKLIIRAISNTRSPDPTQKYTSARLVSHQTLSRPRGTLTAYLTMPCAPGIWPAFWLLPKEPFTWPGDGEIDIAESWNGDCKNHSCLHWGHYNGEDWNKHLVRETHIPDMASPRPIRFDFTWRADDGRLMWSIDGRPVMRNQMPAGTRPIQDFVVLINVAMGGNVCQGRTPADGAFDMVVHSMSMSEEPEGGWDKFEYDWSRCLDGAVM